MKMNTYCNYKAIYPSNLRQHIETFHEKGKYPCDQCNYKANRPNSLQEHIQSIHEGIKIHVINATIQGN